MIAESLNDLSTQAQRRRVLKHLQSQPLTTLEARACLNVMHPAARVMELRQHGHKITTQWRIDHDNEGRPHRVACYVLLSEQEGAA